MSPRRACLCLDRDARAVIFIIIIFSLASRFFRETCYPRVGGYAHFAVSLCCFVLERVLSKKYSMLSIRTRDFHVVVVLFFPFAVHIVIDAFNFIRL